MTWRQIEASREVRLWISQIIVPTVLSVATVAAIPEVRQSIKAKASEIKEKIKTRKPKIIIVKQ